LPLPLYFSFFGLTVQLKNRLVLAILAFLATYVLMVFLWLYLKAFYGAVVTNVAAHLAALVTGSLVDSISIYDEKAVCNFLYQALTVRGPANLHFDAVLHVSQYSYNVPLTVAIVASLLPLIKWRIRFVVEALFLVFFIHLLYVFFYCVLQIYYALVSAGIKRPWKPEQFFWEFSWTFINAMVIRFEPFLIGVFLWFRSSVKTCSGLKKKKQED